MGKVFITGATGFVGRYVVNLLLEKGYEVHAGVRNLGKLKELFKDRVKVYPVDFSSRDSLKRVLEPLKPDFIIHLIGILYQEPGKGITFYRVHTLFSKNLIEVAKEVGVKKLAHMSALGTDDLAPSVYHQTKRWAEKALIESGLNYTIFRPSLILGPEQRLFKDMDQITKVLPVVALPGGGSYRFQPVDVRDVACAFVGALEDTSTDRKTFELCGDEEVSFKRLLEDTFGLMGRRVLMLPMPRKVMFWTAKVVEKLLEPPPLSSDQMLMMWKDNVCSCNGVGAVCKREPIPYRESIRWAVEGYLSGGS